MEGMSYGTAAQTETARNSQVEQQMGELEEHLSELRDQVNKLQARLQSVVVSPEQPNEEPVALDAALVPHAQRLRCCVRMARDVATDLATLRMGLEL